MNEIPNLNDRVRKVDLEKLGTEEDVERVGEALGDKLRVIVDQACEEANKICNIYGLKVKMKFCLKPEDESFEESFINNDSTEE